MEKVNSADGTSIAFQRVGSGPALILIGGAFCDHRARAAGLPLAAGLADRFSVFCYDRRGRGESDDTAPYASAREVEDLAALIGVAGGSAHVYGHSSGALLAIEGAAAGLPITKLSLYEPPIVMGEGREPLPSDLVERLSELAQQGRRSEAAELFLTRAVAVPPPAIAQMKGGPVWPALEALAHTLQYDARLAQDPAAVIARARLVKQSALVIAGERSPTWMRSGVEKLAAAMPAARHVSMAGQTHDVDARLLAPLLLDYFAS
jgi:pimeloyl-ACP methyl ester carboxylesterase